MLQVFRPMLPISKRISSSSNKLPRSQTASEPNSPHGAKRNTGTAVRDSLRCIRPKIRNMEAPVEPAQDAANFRRMRNQEMPMEMRTFGRTGLRISILGFGCGAVGGLMVRGDPADQERAVARALEAGVNYFDTAVAYGDGESEKNLGRILKRLKPADAIVGTKVRLRPFDFTRISDAVGASLDGSLQRLGLERVDIFHFHNPITVNGDGDSLSVRQMLDELVPAFEGQRQRGKTRFLGITAVGDTAALHEVIDARVFDSAQVSYNLLNPSAAAALPANYPAQDYGRLFEHTEAAGVGVVGIRVLAGGALSGSDERHPIASPPPEPIGTGKSYDADVVRGRRLMPLG